MGRLFGTDGVRGLAGVDVTADLALRLAHAAALVLGRHARAESRRALAVVARDPRVSGEFISAAVSAGLAAAGVLGFILSWNEFLFALVLSGPQTATIPVALAALQTSNGVQIGKVAAGVVLAILPLIIASHFIQRFIVKGLTFGSVK